MTCLKKSDPELAKLVFAEKKRQQETLDLIPSENIASRAVREALGSELVNKYSEGYPKKRYYAGNAVADQVEIIARERAKKLFGLGKEWSVNVQALSGSPANMAAYFALLEPGQKFMGLNLTSGGHLTHGSPVNFSGKLFSPVHYDVERNGFIDYQKVRLLAQKEKPKMILAGFTAYPRTVDFKKFGEIAKEAGAYFVVDMAHIAGLVAGGAHPSPFSAGGGQALADVVTTTTHKTLRGPRGALIFSRNDKTIMMGGKEMSIAQAIDKTVFPGLQGGPHDNQTAAIAVALGEAMKPSFKKYAHQIVKNARTLANELKKLGLEIISGGTDNHLMLVDLTNLGISGREGQDRLEKAGIIVNRNTVPYDTRSPFDPSGIRLGTPSITTRGMKEKEMKEVAELIYQALRDGAFEIVWREIRRICKKFPIGV